MYALDKSGDIMHHWRTPALEWKLLDRVDNIHIVRTEAAYLFYTVVSKVFPVVSSTALAILVQ